MYAYKHVHIQVDIKANTQWWTDRINVVGNCEFSKFFPWIKFGHLKLAPFIDTHCFVH